MKLEPDISGVCRITGTREMITWPAIAASMKMYSATKPSLIASCSAVPRAHARPDDNRRLNPANAGQPMLCIRVYSNVDTTETGADETAIPRTATDARVRPRRHARRPGGGG